MRELSDGERDILHEQRQEALAAAMDEQPKPVCSICGEVPWEELRYFEEGTFTREYEVERGIDKDGKFYTALGEDLGPDDNVTNSYYFHLKTFNDPDPQCEACKGTVTF